MARDAGRSRRGPQRYPPIADYGLISDCHSAALVSRTGSIDWCCMPRLDAGSVFGRLLDWKAGGFYSIEPTAPEAEWFRTYLEDTMVLVTTIRTGGGQARILDCFALPRQDPGRDHRRLLRVIEGERGVVPLRVRIVPRFDYGEIKPWVRHHDVRAFSAIGGDDGLAITGDADLEVADEHDLAADLEGRVGERLRLPLVLMRPEEIDAHPPETPKPEELDRLLEETIDSWRR